MPNTPKGTRICPTLMPLGCRRSWVISPTGSGMAAICSQPSATVSMIFGVSFNRSTIGAVRPAACAASMSFALAGASAAASLRSRRASAIKALFFAAVGAAAICVLAAGAAAPMWAMVAWRSVEVMQRLSQRPAAQARTEFVARMQSGDVPLRRCCLPSITTPVACRFRQHTQVRAQQVTHSNGVVRLRDLLRKMTRDEANGFAIRRLPKHGHLDLAAFLRMRTALVKRTAARRIQRRRQLARQDLARLPRRLVDARRARQQRAGVRMPRRGKE